MKTALLVVAACGAAASADVTPIAGFSGHTVIDYQSGQVTQPTRGASEVVYSALTGVGSARSQATAATVYDDLQFAGDGIIDSLTFSIVNFGTANYTGGNVSVVLDDYVGFAAPGANLAVLNVDLTGQLDIGAGGFTQLITPTNLEGLGLTVNAGDQIWAGVRFDDAGNVADGDLAQLITAPSDIGFSQDLFYDNGLLFFGGSPYANFGWEITTIPAPAGLAMLGLGGLVATRRRR